MTFANLEDFKRRVVIALFSDADLRKSVVLKGGNLLDLAYGISTRPSQDIDLSIAGEFPDLETTRSVIERALRRTFTEEGYHVFDVTLQEEPASITEDLRDFWGGYRVAEYFRVDFGRDEFHEVVRKVFSAKRAPLRLLGLIGTPDVREFHRPDFLSVVDTVKPGSNIQTYDYYHAYVVGKCQSLEPLWNE